MASGKPESKKLRTLAWGMKLAWKIDKRILMFWIVVNSALSILPAITLIASRKVIASLSANIGGEDVAYTSLLQAIILLGVSLCFTSIVNRVNSDFFYNLMLKTYLVGMQEILIDVAQNIELKELYKTDVNNEYFFVVDRASSLSNMLSGICVIIGKLVTVISLLVMATSYSLQVFIILLVYIAVTAVLYIKYIMKNETTVMTHRKAMRHADYLERLPETPGIAKEIRMFHLQNHIQAQWLPSMKSIAAENVKFRTQFSLIDFVTGILFSVTALVALIFTAVTVKEHMASPDMFLTLYYLFINTLTAVTSAQEGVSLLSYGLLLTEKQMRFFEKHDSQKPKNMVVPDPEVGADAYYVENMSFSYQTGKKVLRNISFTIKRGETIALVGMNGSGKTTLIKLLLGLLPPDTGTIRLRGVDIRHVGHAYIRNHVGVFFQDFYLFHHKLRENIGYGGIEQIDNDKMIMEAIEKGGAADLIKKMPRGLDTYCGNKIHEGAVFSGGERQKIGASRAYMNEREILIFDEPASALDPIAELEQFMRIQNRLDGKTAILISHRVGFARMADRIILLENGEIAEMGSHDQLIRQKGKYAAYFRQQSQWYDLDLATERE